MTILTYRWPRRVHALASGGDPDPPPPPPPPSTGTGILRHGTPPMQFGPSTGWMNQPRPTDGSLLIDSTTPAVQAELVAEAPSGTTQGARPYFATTHYSIPVFVVGPDQPRVPVKIHAGAADGTGVPNYQKEMQQIMLDPGVPLPDEYVNQGDSDDECMLVEVDASGNLLRVNEFWRLRPITPMDYTFTQSDGTSVTYTGVKWECSCFWNVTTPATHPGRSRNHNIGTYPNAPNPVGAAKRLDTEDTNMQVSATVLPFCMTQLTVEDVTRVMDPATGLLTGVMPDHMLNLSVLHPRSGDKYWPASKTDGWVAGSPLYEGMRLFLDHTVYTDAHINAMNVEPLCRVVMKFAVTHGIIIVDKAGCLEIDAEPGVHDYTNGVAPSAVLNGFPWGDMQAMARTNADGSALTDASPFPH